MSLSGALSNALSGLTAASRSAQVTASNLANVMTEGYSRREVQLSARSSGGQGGVMISGVTRHASPGLIAERRMALSDQSGATRLADYYTRLESLVGTPDKADSLSARMSELEASLVDAASRPDLSGRLNTVLSAANSLTAGFKTASDGLQKLRGDADTEIAATVKWLNTALSQVRDLNVSITSASVTGSNPSALQDQRQVLIDEIAGIVPVTAYPRDHGAVALFTAGGGVLLDGTPAELSFDQSNIITPHMTQANGLLSGLKINAVPVSTAPGTGPIQGGRLAALFQIRDDLAVSAQTQLDATARDLVERFQGAGIDGTLASGDAGLFTDNGNAFSASDETGLSARLSINAAADPDQGGATWRLRDGLGAIAPGAVGNAQLLQAMGGVLEAGRSPVTGTFGAALQSASALQATFISQIGADRDANDQLVSFATARYTTANAGLLADGVDSDQEMQQMMLIEQAYAANARMMQAVDDMMKTLTGL